MDSGSPLVAKGARSARWTVTSTKLPRLNKEMLARTCTSIRIDDSPSPQQQAGDNVVADELPTKSTAAPGFARVVTEEVPAAGTSTRQAGTEESAISGSSGVATTRAPPSGLPQGQPKVEEEEEEEEKSGGLHCPAFGLRFSAR